MLAERRWKRKYTREDGDLVRLFYIPALEDAERYDRLTGYFSAGALALAARGIEGLVRNSGRMRLLVGCTLEPAEIEAIQQGESLRRLVERHMESVPLAPPDAESSAALELLAWMVASGHLEVKVGVPCDSEGRPVPDQGIFHEKAGVVADRAGDRLAWNGSLNETAAGWQRNWESISVFTSWGLDPGWVDEEEANFARLWANRNRSVAVLAVPDAIRQDLMRFRPREGEPPVRLKEGGATRENPLDASMPKPKRDRGDAEHLGPDMRSRVWSFIAKAPSLSGGGARVGEATSAVIPWAHQVRAFNRLYGHWPPRLLIADEVGLGKTIQAGLLVRQAWLAGRAGRILILAPKAVLRQWQIERMEADEAADRERQAMAGLEANDIRQLLGMIDALPPDSKLAELQTVLGELREAGFGQTMVFTQFTDTMDFLRDSLRAGGSYVLMCFSGRGGEIPTADGDWRVIDRDEVKRRFRDGEADLLLCTDAAAEGLNFQFCGSLVNYDMPWNPMRVEQRIGRIDRVGQKHDRIRIVNLNYEDTIETDVYRALRDRIGLFETVVGRLQPILARLPGAIADAVRTGDATDEARRARVVDKIEQQARESETGGFDLDAVLEDDIEMPERPAPAMEMPDLDRVIGNPDLMPPGTVVAPLRQREYSLLAPGMSEAVRVTTDPAYYEQHAESMELWSPGNPLFKGPELVALKDDADGVETLSQLFDARS